MWVQKKLQVETGADCFLLQVANLLSKLEKGARVTAKLQHADNKKEKLQNIFGDSIKDTFVLVPTKQGAPYILWKRWEERKWVVFEMTVEEKRSAGKRIKTMNNLENENENPFCLGPLKFYESIERIW